MVLIRLQRYQRRPPQEIKDQQTRMDGFGKPWKSWQNRTASNGEGHKKDTAQLTVGLGFAVPAWRDSARLGTVRPPGLRPKCLTFSWSPPSAWDRRLGLRNVVGPPCVTLLEPHTVSRGLSQSSCAHPLIRPISVWDCSERRSVSAAFVELELSCGQDVPSKRKTANRRAQRDIDPAFAEFPWKHWGPVVSYWNYTTRMATWSGFSKVREGFVDHKWSKKCPGDSRGRCIDRRDRRLKPPEENHQKQI